MNMPDWFFKSKRMLEEFGVKFTIHNNGYHFIIHTEKQRIDFWPSTGKFYFYVDKIKGEGLAQLVELLEFGSDNELNI